MYSLISRLWSDDAGFIVSAELVLVATIVIIGMITGLVAVRDSVTSELTEVGQAIGSVDQSYSFSGLINCNSKTAGSAACDSWTSVNSGRTAVTCCPINVDPCTRAN